MKGKTLLSFFRPVQRAEDKFIGVKGIESSESESNPAKKAKSSMEELEESESEVLSDAEAIEKEEQKENHSPKQISRPKKVIEQSKPKCQLYLDIGQKSFSHYTCPDCKMTFQRGVEKDEALHSKYHKRFKLGLTFKLAPAVLESLTRWESLEHGYRIIQIDTNSSSVSESIKKKALKVLETINCDVMSASSEDILNASMIYICLSKEKNIVIGLLSSERIEKAFKSSKNCKDSSDNFIIEVDEKIQYSALIGVNRIWCHQGYRKKGIATALLDCLRRSFIFGTTVPKEKVAFSQPTQMGYALAKRYFESEQFLIYFTQH